MAIVLPTGWTGFQGGGSDPDLCGEPQDCDSPPCGEIPTMEIVPVDEEGNPTGAQAELSCLFGGELHHLNIQVLGGVPPFEWIVTAGTVTIVDARTISINIHPDPNGDGDVAFFRPFLIYSTESTGGISPCSPPENFNTEVVADVRLGAYDCLGIHIPTTIGGFDDNIPPWRTDAPFAHPIGDDDADRTMVMTIGYGGTPTHVGPDPKSPTLESIDHEWSAESFRCTTGSPCCASVKVTAKVAGRNGVHGTIWSGAPDFASEDKDMPIPSEALLPNQLPYNSYIDVRTQTQIDNGCCVVPDGTDIVVVVTDARGVEAVIVIPVV